MPAVTSCVVPTKPRYGSPDDHERARQLGKRVETEMREQGLSAESLAERAATARGPGAVFVERIIRLREDAGMRHADLGHELGVDARTVQKMEMGQAAEIVFTGGQGAANMRRLIHGELSWSGSSSTKRWVGPGYELVAQLEKIFDPSRQAGWLGRGIWIPEDTGSLEGRVMRDTTISDDKRRMLLAILRADV